MRKSVFIHRGIPLFALVYIFLIAAAPNLPGQVPQRVSHVSGEVAIEGGSALDQVTVELAAQGQVVARSPVTIDGSFEFRDITEGTYEARVVTLVGVVVYRTPITISTFTDSLSLNVPSLPGSKPPGGVISVKQLIPDKARREFVRAEQAFKKGKLDESIRRLEKAIRIHSTYLEAHNNLGARMMWKRNHERAAAEFLIVTELDGKWASGHTNLALALVALKRYSEAARAARRALELDPDYLPARYALGLSDAALNNCTAAAVENLKMASERYPRARLAAAHVLSCRGETAEAEAQVQAYHEARAKMERAEAPSSESAGVSSQ